MNTFTFPEDAIAWGSRELDVEVNGVVIRCYAFTDPTTHIGRVFFASDDHRIMLLGPKNNNGTPLMPFVDGEAIPRPLGTLGLYDSALVAVEHMQRIDRIHEGLDNGDE